MPRINRSDVTFVVNDRTWLARFTHDHNAKGIIYKDRSGKEITVKHITTCRLSHLAKATVYVTGTSPCSLSDDYNWRKGITRAFKKALERAGYCRFDKDTATRRETVVKLKDDYPYMVRQFAWEMEILDYPPHNTVKQDAVKVLVADRKAPPITLEGEVIASELVGEAPESTKNGTAHLGMD